MMLQVVSKTVLCNNLIFATFGNYHELVIFVCTMNGIELNWSLCPDCQYCSFL